MTKKGIRKEIAHAISLMNTRQRAQASAAIVNRILESREYTESSTILLYVPLPDEVDITDLIERSLRDGKTTALPVITGRDLIFRRIDTSWPARLRRGPLDVREPTEGYGDLEIDETQDVLVITPGRAYTEEKVRLGRGGGYYDRYLESLQAQAMTMAPAFECQIVESIPRLKHDRNVECIMTERREIR